MLTYSTGAFLHSTPSPLKNHELFILQPHPLKMLSSERYTVFFLFMLCRYWNDAKCEGSDESVLNCPLPYPTRPYLSDCDGIYISIKQLLYIVKGINFVLCSSICEWRQYSSKENSVNSGFFPTLLSFLIADVSKIEAFSFHFFPALVTSLRAL